MRKKDNLNDEIELERARQVPAPELECRISALIELFGTREKAASIASLSTDQLARYQSGDGKPSFVPVAKMAVAKGVRLEWLATGEGAMTAETAPLRGSQAGRFEAGILGIAAGLLNDLLEAMDGRLSGDDYAKTLLELADLLQNDEKAVPAKVVEISRFIAQRKG